MHTRQSGAAHVNVFFFLVMLVLFLAAMGTAYVTMEKNNELIEKARSADARTADVEKQLFIYKHYVEDLAKEVGETGTYAGRVFIEGADSAKATAHIPTGAGGTQIHLILEVRDENPIASLRDYRRVVVDVASEIIELDSKQK